MSDISLPSRRASVDSQAMSDTSAGGFTLQNDYLARLNKERSRPAKFVVFNTGAATSAHFYKVIRTTMGDTWNRSLLSVSRVDKRGSRPRLIIEVKPELAEILKRGLREATRDSNPHFRAISRNLLREPELRGGVPGKWRLTEFKPFRKRRTRQEVVLPDEAFSNILTWNVNGFQSKFLEIEDALLKQKVGIAMLQETLQNSSRRPLRIRGYNTFEYDREEGFRGQAILVDNRIPAYHIPHAEKHILHVKVSQWKTSDVTLAFHVFSLYLPSGGNKRRERTVLFTRLEEIVRETLRADPHAQFILAGDLNDDVEVVRNRMRGQAAIRLLEMKGSTLTRFPKRGNPSSLDHFLASEFADRFFKKPRVLRRYGISDHRPVVLRALANLEPSVAPPVKAKFDRRMMDQKRQEIAHHNKWTILDEEGTDIDTICDTFNRDSDLILRDLGVKYDTESRRPTSSMPKSLKTPLRRLKRLTKKLTKQQILGEVDVNLEARVTELRMTFNRKKDAWEQDKEVRDYTRVGEDMLSGDLKSAWTRLNTKTHRESTDGVGMPLRPNQPLRDREGRLCTDPAEVNRIMTEHYRSLHQDIPAPTFRRTRYWEVNIPELVTGQKPQPEVCEDIGWQEVLGTIRAMNRDTSPGSEEVHINMMKALVREESMAQLQAKLPNRYRWDGIQVDLRLEEMPEVPQTPLGKAVFSLLHKFWNTGIVPTSWHRNVVISLFKGGDPEMPSNYRGITLISVTQKILCGVIMKRLYQHMEASDLLDKAQAGFRPGEEAIAHFTALAEIVRRRYLIDKVVPGNFPTYAAFIDLKKAFDKVPHQLIFRLLKTYGFPQHLIDMIEAIYASTMISVRAGGIDSDAYELWRGLRQGCLLSPTLFIIFVLGLLEHVNEKAGQAGGVGTPRRIPGRDSAGVCHGLLYADDIVSLSESIPELKGFLGAFVEWCKLWGMEVGLGKCGIICWTSSDEKRSEFERTSFQTPIGAFPKVDDYKYLGVVADLTLPFSRESKEGVRANELSYVHALAEKGRRTLHQLRPALIDPSCPVPIKAMLVRTFLVPVMLYGAEWIGLKRTHADPLQRVLNTAAHWIVGLKGTTNLVDSTVLCHELNLPLMEEELAASRARLYYKARKTVKGGTWLSKLVQTEAKSGREFTWVHGSKSMLSTLLKDRNKYSTDTDINWFRANFAETREKEVPLRLWAAIGQVLELEVKSNTFRSRYLDELRESIKDVGDLDPESVSEEQYVNLARRSLANARDGFDPAYERFMTMEAINGGNSKRHRWESERVRAVREVVRERSWTSNASVTFGRYDRWFFGMTRGFLRHTIRRSDIREGVRWLVVVRTGIFPSVRKFQLRADFAGRQYDDGGRRPCPLCGEDITDGWDWAHLLVRCLDERIVRLQDEYLVTSVLCITNEWEILGETPTQGIEVAGMESKDVLMAVLLAGGATERYHSCTYTIGYGVTDLLPLEMSEPGYVPVAQFLQQAAPIYFDSLQGKYGASTVTSARL